MSQLDVYLFGQLEIRSRGDTLRPFPTKKSKGLFAYLVAHRGRAFPRDVLAGMFWGDQPEHLARKSLRTAIWRARSVIEPTGVAPGTYISAKTDGVAFNGMTDVRVDVEEFERRIASAGRLQGGAESPFVYRSLQDAVRLYRADFLEGVYDGWAERERNRLQSLLLGTLVRLTACCSRRRDWAGAIMWSTRLLALDPLREDTQRDLMRFYCLAGNRAAALRAFDKLRKLLRSEVGVPPMCETLALFERILSGESLDDGQGQPEQPIPRRKLEFAPPAVRPLVLMRQRARQVGDLKPSAAIARGLRRSGPH